MQSNCLILVKQKRQIFDNAVILEVTQWLYEGSIITHNQLRSSRYTVEAQIVVPASPTAKCNIMQRSSVVK